MKDMLERLESVADKWADDNIDGVSFTYGDIARRLVYMGAKIRKNEQ